MAETQNMYPINVYKIWYADAPEDVYVGSTKERLCKRMSAHRTDSRRGKPARIYQVMREKGDTNFQHCLLGTCMVRNKDEQRLYEQTWIDRLNPTLNSIRAYISEEHKKENHKEHNKEYYQRPEIKQRHKEYHQRPEIKQRQKEYDQRPEIKQKKKEYEQKPEIKQMRKEYSQRPEIKQRQKEYSQRPENKQKMKEYKQKPEIKQKIKEYMKEYRQKKHYCEYCDKSMVRSAITYHCGTRTHKDNYKNKFVEIFDMEIKDEEVPNYL